MNTQRVKRIIAVFLILFGALTLLGFNFGMFGKLITALIFISGIALLLMK